MLLARPPHHGSSRRGFAAPFLSSLVLFVGCVSPYRAMSLQPEDPAHMRANAREEPDPAGFLIAATLLDTTEEATEYFHHDLPERGIVPVLVHFENRGSSIVRIHRDTIQLALTDEGGTTIQPLPPRTVIRESQLSYWRAAVWLPLVLPVYFVREQVRQFNFDIARDVLRKALPEFIRILPDDPPFSRVLFFRVGPALQAFLDRPTSLEVPVEIEARSDPRGIGKDALISVGMHR